MKNQIKQEERLRGSLSHKDEGFEINDASTTGDAFSRKHSHHEHASTTNDLTFSQNDENFDDEDQDEEEQTNVG